MLNEDASPVAASPTPMFTGREDDEKLVIDLINQIQCESDSQQKVNLLCQVEEILLRKQPSIMPIFLKRVLEFHLDTSSSVKCFLSQFIQKLAITVCTTLESIQSPQTLSIMKDCVETLLYLYNDGSPKVLKSVISSTTVCYMRSLLLICKITMNMQTQTDCTKLWSIMTQLKRRMADSLDNEHEGVRTQAIHFFEYLVIAYSSPPPSPIIVATRKGSKFTNKQSDDEFNLSMIPMKHPLLDMESIRKEGEQYFGLLLTNATNKSIKYSNISVIHQCMFNIAKQRTNWWDQIIPILYDPPLPPQLTSSQQISLRFSQRSILLYLLKMPALKQFRNPIAATLKKLDTKSDAIDSAIRYADRAVAASASRSKEQDATKSQSDKKRKIAESEEAPKKKKKKHRPEMEATGTIPPLSILFDTPIGSYHAVDLANIVVDNFLASNVQPKDSNYQLSFISFANILMNMTSELEKQDNLELQTFVSEPLPPKSSQEAASIQDPRLADPRLAAAMQSEGMKMEDEDESQVIIQRRVQTEQEIEEKKVARQIITHRDFESKARQLSAKDKKFLLNVGWEHIVTSETEINREGKQTLRIALLVKMISKKSETNDWFTDLLKHIKQDVKARMDLALQWLHQEYTNCCINHKKKQSRNILKEETQDGDIVKTEQVEEQEPISFSRYENLFHSILGFLKEELEPNDLLFARFYVQAPRITTESLNIVRSYIEDPIRLTLGLITLRDIVLRREPVRNLSLTYMLEYAIHENSNIRTAAVRILVDQLLSVPYFTERIEEFAKDAVKKLLEPSTLESIKHIAEQKRQQQLIEHEQLVQSSTEKIPDMPKINFEAEQVIRHCSLISSLCLLKSEFFTLFLSIFSELKKQDVDKAILDALAIELRSLARLLGTQSPVIMNLLKSFPDELEELVLHFVEDLTPPTVLLSPEIVSAIKSIFFSRPQKNARFLLPVMVFLTKEEVDQSLEHILNLDNTLLKVSIHRLIQANMNGVRKDAYTPQELLITLHKYDHTTDQALLKKIAFATTSCFGREYRQIFTPNVLAAVIQHLVDMTPMPQLLMRTVIQTLKNYPEMEEFIAGTLVKLIQKQIWENKSLWIGFVKCLDQMKDRSVARVHEILAQLPSKCNHMIFTDKANAAMKEKLRMFCIATQPRNSTDNLLKHLGFKYNSQREIVTLSREETAQVAKEYATEEPEAEEEK